MALLRMLGKSGDGLERLIHSGDLIAGGQNLVAGALTTVGAGTILGAMIASGVITRTGPVAGFTDTTDTADAILKALSAAGVNAEPGITFDMLYVNTVAQALTMAAGRGVTLDTTNGTGVLTNAGSLVRKYLWTILNSSPEVNYPCSLVTGTKVITFTLPPNAVALPLQGSNGASGVMSVTPGMIVSGTGITAGTKVLGITQGQGGATGLITDTNNASTQALTNLTFSPNLLLSSLGTFGL